MKQLLGIFILAVLSLFFASPFSYAQSKAPAGSRMISPEFPSIKTAAFAVRFTA